MGLLLLLGSALLIVLTAGPRYSAGQGVLMTLTPAQQQEIVDQINDCRRNVNPTATNMRKVYWSNEAAVTAAKYVVKCNWAHSAMEQRTISTTRCGENIYRQNGPYAPSVAAIFWCNEQNNFIYGRGAINEAQQYQHYTQQVWATSCNVGCAMAKCGAEIWTVCHQCPPGNLSTGKITAPYKSGPSCSACSGPFENKLCTKCCQYENKGGDDNCEPMKSMCAPQQTSLMQSCDVTCNNRCP